MSIYDFEKKESVKGFFSTKKPDRNKDSFFISYNVQIDKERISEILPLSLCVLSDTYMIVIKKITLRDIENIDNADDKPYYLVTNNIYDYSIKPNLAEKEIEGFVLIPRHKQIDTNYNTDNIILSTRNSKINKDNIKKLKFRSICVYNPNDNMEYRSVIKEKLKTVVEKKEDTKILQPIVQDSIQNDFIENDLNIKDIEKPSIASYQKETTQNYSDIKNTDNVDINLKDEKVKFLFNLEKNLSSGNYVELTMQDASLNFYKVDYDYLKDIRPGEDSVAMLCKVMVDLFEDDIKKYKHMAIGYKKSLCSNEINEIIFGIPGIENNALLSKTKNFNYVELKKKNLAGYWVYTNKIN